MDYSFLKNPLDKDIIGLLAVSNLPPLEKQLWVKVIPEMSEEEKMKLKQNLEAEVQYEEKVSNEAAEQFLTALNSIMAP